MKKRASGSLNAAAFAPKQAWQELQSIKDKIKNIINGINKCEAMIEYHQQELDKSKDRAEDLYEKKNELQANLETMAATAGDDHVMQHKVRDMTQWINHFHSMMGKGAENVSKEDLNDLMAGVPSVPVFQETQSDKNDAAQDVSMGFSFNHQFDSDDEGFGRSVGRPSNKPAGDSGRVGGANGADISSRGRAGSIGRGRDRARSRTPNADKS